MSVESKLEKLLEGGTWLSTLVVGVGVLFSLMLVTQIGIAMFILIPVMRVLGLVINFYSKKDFKMFGIALVVFCIIMVSFVIGIALK